MTTFPKAGNIFRGDIGFVMVRDPSQKIRSIPQDYDCSATGLQFSSEFVFHTEYYNCRLCQSFPEGRKIFRRKVYRPSRMDWYGEVYTYLRNLVCDLVGLRFGSEMILRTQCYNYKLNWQLSEGRKTFPRSYRWVIGSFRMNSIRKHWIIVSELRSWLRRASIRFGIDSPNLIL